MKRDFFAFIILSVLSITAVFGQMGNMPQPVKWEVQSKPTAKENVYELTYTATIEPGWFIYTQHVKEGGPVPTSIHIESSTSSVTEASEKGEVVKKGMDDVFDMELTKYGKKATFVQEVQTKEKQISGYIEFMSCNATSCLPPDTYEFSVETVGQKKK